MGEFAPVELVAHGDGDGAGAWSLVSVIAIKEGVLFGEAVRRGIWRD